MSSFSFLILLILFLLLGLLGPRFNRLVYTIAGLAIGGFCLFTYLYVR
ncbi:MAG TPA: hypothetical protein VKX16_19460 [Chloroflexota bacterium]|nr:hypothetical protein [Chloroflexota bacterium]